MHGKDLPIGNHNSEPHVQPHEESIDSEAAQLGHLVLINGVELQDPREANFVHDQVEAEGLAHIEYEDREIAKYLSGESEELDFLSS